MWRIARDFAKVEDQVQFLDRLLPQEDYRPALTRLRGECARLLVQPLDGLLLNTTLEPEGQATGCNPVEVGSTPTGVSLKQGPLMLCVQRRAQDPLGFLAHVPCMGSKRAVSVTVSSVGRAPEP